MVGCRFALAAGRVWSARWIEVGASLMMLAAQIKLKSSTTAKLYNIDVTQVRAYQVRAQMLRRWPRAPLEQPECQHCCRWRLSEQLPLDSHHSRGCHTKVPARMPDACDCYDFVMFTVARCACRPEASSFCCCRVSLSLARLSRIWFGPCHPNDSKSNT